MILLLVKYEEEEENPSGSLVVETTDTYGYFDLYTFKAPNAGEYTFTVPAGLGFYSKAQYDAWNNAEVDFGGTEDETVVVTLSANEEYSFYVAAMSKDTWTITWTCVLSQGGSGDTEPEEPEVVKDANGLGGEYSITWLMPNMFVLTFTPTSQGATTGTLVVVDNNKAANGGTFTYEIINGAYVIYKNGTVTSDVIISSNLINWTFQNQSVLQPQAFAEYVLPESGETSSDALVLGDNIIVVTEDNLTDGEFTMEFTPALTGNYTFASQALFISNVASSTATIEAVDYAYALEADVTYTITISTNYIWAAGEYGLNITYVEEEEEVLTGSFDVEVTDTYSYIDKYTFTATTAATYTFTVPSGVGVFEQEAYANFGAPYVDFYDNGGTFTVTLEAEESVTFLVGSLEKGTYSLTWTTASSEEGDDEETVENGPLVVGENVINVSQEQYDSGSLTVEFTPALTGNYTFASQALFISNVASSTATIEAVDYAYALEADVTYTITISTNYIWAAGEYRLNVTYVEEVEIATSLSAGQNIIAVTEENITDGQFTMELTVDAAGNYQFASSLYVASITPENGEALVMNDDYTYTLEANVTYTVTLSTMMVEEPGNQEMNITIFEEEETPSITELVVGENEFTLTEDDIITGYINVEFFTLEAGDYTFTSEIAMSIYDSEDNYLEANQDGSYTFGIYSTYKVVLHIEELTAGDYSITVACTPAAPSVSELVVGNNEFTLTEDDLFIGFLDVEFTVSEAGNYDFDGEIAIHIYDSEDNYIEQNADESYTLAAGTYTIRLVTEELQAGTYAMNIVLAE